MKEIVLPGEKIADGKLRLPNTFTEGDATYASVIGLRDEEGKYLALEARYKPHEGDTVVGVVMDAKHAGYDVDIGMPFCAFIPARDIRINLVMGALVVAQVREVQAIDIDLTDVRRLPSGQLLEFPPSKVPRLIGKKSSMINMIQEKTGGEIAVGNNGYVWVSENSDLQKVIKALELIDQKAHMSGLTNLVSDLLNK